MKIAPASIATVLVLLCCCIALCGLAVAQDFQWYPEDITYDATVPTLEDVVGHDWAERITSHAELERYLQALAEASPKVRLEKYGETYEGRALYYLVIASEENHARIEEIRAGIHALSDPRTLDATEADALIADLPALVWLAYSVHGNEVSSTEAATRAAYHFAAAQGDELTDSVLANTVVLMDPLQNADGRDRFVSFYRQAKGRWPSSNLASIEMNEPWPGGRTNHYLFDMNRDWFAQTQQEVRAKVAAYRHWRPQVYADLHEMGGDSTYYFPPQAIPWNPNQAPTIMDWLVEIGSNNARWFDRMGWDYFTRETFDSFYPGYGASWPMYQGAVGMTYEQASSRGIARDRSDETVLHFRDTVHHHFIASLSTAQAVAANRAEILRHFYEFYQKSIAEGGADAIKEILIEPGSDPNRTAKLIGLLMSEGIEVDRAEAPFVNAAAGSYYPQGSDGPVPGPRATARREFPAGTYRISLAQPAKHLIKTLLSPQVEMEEEFVTEQLRRYARREGDQIYDITAWSLPLLYDLSAYTAGVASAGEFTTLEEAPSGVGGVHGGPATVAYLVPWGTNSAIEGLSSLHKHGVRVHSAGDSFSIGGRDYPAGSLIIKVADNADNIHDEVATIAAHHNVDFYATDTSWVDDGINFGSNQVRYLPKPKIALAYGSPASSGSAGAMRYMLERAYAYPVTAIQVDRVIGTLDDFNVLILPSAGGRFGGGYGQAFSDSEVRELREWIQDGGTLVALGGATAWLASEEVGLMPTDRRLKTNEEDPDADEGQGSAEPGSVAEGEPQLLYLPEEETPASIPGAILRAKLDTEHWLAFGYDGDANVLAGGNAFYEPLKMDQGNNVGVFYPAETVLTSGFIWEPERELVAGSAYLMHRPVGRGHVVAFVEDPSFRAYLVGLNGLLFNALFLGPGY